MTDNSFTCEKYRCTLSRKACAARQVEMCLAAGGRTIPAYPGCQNCEQGMREAKGITIAETRPRRLWNSTPSFQARKGAKTMYPSKIDDTILKQMIAGGAPTADIAKKFDCTVGAVMQKANRLGLKLNRVRKTKGAAAAAIAGPPPSGVPQPSRPAEPKVFRGRDLLPAAPVASGKEVPLTLRLTIEVNVRVRTEAA